MQILPGSGNLIGGRSVTLKNVPSRTVQAMKFPGAPYGLKMACGENPKRVYGEKNRAPSTAMGNMAGYRAAWIRAAKYRDDLAAWQKGRRRPGQAAHARPAARDAGGRAHRARSWCRTIATAPTRWRR
jgi:imidazolonepropionase-like amidohydrolase